jgi:4,5-DOPA dioxygenase extradiol
MKDRRDVLRYLAAGACALLPMGCARSGDGRRDDPKETPMTSPANDLPGDRMPVVFVGHGSPMNVIEDNQWSQGFAALREQVPRPSAILAVSAHWFVSGIYLTGDLHPRTIHDFSGFPRALYEITYPAPGKVDLAERVRGAIGSERAALSADWGLDHGTWSVLRWMYPEADIPVVQLSIDRRLEPRRHYELARSLTELRHEGVLILGSGNIVHNLRDAVGRMRSGTTDTPDWAARFDDTVKQAVSQHDARAVIDLWPGTDDGRLAHPSPDHWLPLLYTLGATDDRDPVRFPTEGFDWGSISMRNIVFG